MYRYIIGLSILLLSCMPTSGFTTENTVNTTYGTGKHTVEIFTDFQCPACINFSHTILPIIESAAASGQIQVIYRQYPLTNIHQNAYGDALAVLCGAEQWAYQTYARWLISLESKKSWARVSNGDRVRIARDRHLHIRQFVSCLNSKKYHNQIVVDMARWDALGLQGTPTVYIDSKKLDLGMIFADFEKGKILLSKMLAE